MCPIRRRNEMVEVISSDWQPTYYGLSINLPWQFKTEEPRFFLLQKIGTTENQNKIKKPQKKRKIVLSCDLSIQLSNLWHKLRIDLI